MRHSFLFFINAAQIQGDYVHFSVAESHHISDVLRKGRGEKIRAVDGQGHEYGIILKDRKSDRWWGEIGYKRIHEQDPPVPLSLALPCLKSNRWEILVEAACAMGVAEIWLTDFAGAAVRWSESRKERAGKKAVEALKQSGGSLLTRIQGPIPCRELLAHGKFELVLCADPEGERLDRVGGNALLLIGPESGLQPAELVDVQKEKLIKFNLGTRRLRSEIAGICALELVRSRILNVS